MPIGTNIDALPTGTVLTALHAACSYDGEIDESPYLSIVSHLISQKVDVNALDTYEATPLNVAIYKNHKKIVKMLAEAGALNLRKGQKITYPKALEVVGASNSKGGKFSKPT